VAPLLLAEPGPFVIGRSSEADWTIPDQAVSRRHAHLSFVDGRWLIRDLDSRHGTTVNGRRLEPGEQSPIEPGDLVRFGVWSCRCVFGDEPARLTTSFDGVGDVETVGQSVSAVRELRGLAQVRLDALLTLSKELNESETDDDVGEAIVRAISAATACKRVLVVRPASSEKLEILASTTTEPPRISRSLIEAADSGGELVELRGKDGADQAHSIMSLSIRSAICAPIVLEGASEAFVYLDTRESERALAEDTAAFCRASAQLAGLALERLRRAELSARHAQLTRDLDAARHAQELLMPPGSGVFGPVRYAFESRPGRIVAGDLFDIFPLAPHRVALFLGDVAGKGVGAAVLMAAAQSELRSHLLSGRPLGEAVSLVNRDLCARTEPGKFVTLLAGVIDAHRGRLELVDAGHGFGVLAVPGALPIRIDAAPGFPIGVVEDHEYETTMLDFQPGSTIVMFSDGVAEQPSPGGEQFGTAAALGVIAGVEDSGLIPGTLLEAVRNHAMAELADDLTVASATLTASKAGHGHPPSGQPPSVGGS